MVRFVLIVSVLLSVMVAPDRLGSNVMVALFVTYSDGIAQGTRPGIGVGDDRAGLEFHRADVNLRPHEPGQATLVGGKLLVATLPASMAGEPGKGGIVCVGPP